VIFDKGKNAAVEIADPKGPDGRTKLAVKLGITNGVRAEVLSGLNEGQKVILQ